MLSASWQEILSAEFEKPYFVALKNFLREEYATKTIYPPKNCILNAFYLCPLEKVKVVLLGQDPYHGIGQAHGLSFSVLEGVMTPPSLQNIFKEITADLGPESGQNLHFSSGNLTSWAQQGVLLLNATLTVEAHKAASHQGKGWEQFTDKVIHTLSQKCEHLVFLLWGSYAIQKKILIDAQKHLILQAPHPSPLSAHRGFLGCRHFSKTNIYLQEKGKHPILWHPALKNYYENLALAH